MVCVSCESIGIEGCAFACEADKERRVEAKMMEHLREEHPEVVAGLTIEEHDQLRARIKEGLRAGEA